jgi:sialic acid synthase SpsE
MVEGIRFIEKMSANPVDKDEIARESEPLRKIFTKSIVAQVDLPKGTVLRNEHLTVKKPGWGINADRWNEVIGARLTKSLKADEILHFDHLEYI